MGLDVMVMPLGIYFQGRYESPLEEVAQVPVSRIGGQKASVSAGEAKP